MTERYSSNNSRRRTQQSRDVMLAVLADGKEHTTWELERACLRAGFTSSVPNMMLTRMVASGVVRRVRTGFYIMTELGCEGTQPTLE